MAKKTVLNPHGLDQIYARRQPKRPHYLRDWIERRGFKTDSEFAEAVRADKSVVSRWLDDNDPTTPGKEWQLKLGIFFGGEADPADISAILTTIGSPNSSARAPRSRFGALGRCWK